METFPHTPSRKSHFSRRARRAFHTAARDESGVVAVIVALLMTALLTAVALVIDLGALYDHDRELQTAADAGALAGAQELFYTDGDTAAAADKTTEYVEANSAPNSDVNAGNIDYESFKIDKRSVEVALRESGVKFSFAPVIGQTEGSVTAYAKAELMYLTGIENLFPIALPYVHPDHFHIIYENGGSNIVHELTNEEYNPDDPSSDQGIYDTDPENRTAVLSPGLHTVSVTARNEDDTEDLLTWGDIGSVYVPPPDSAIESVSLYRDINVPGDPEADLTETLYVQIRIAGLPKNEQAKVQVAWGKNSKSTIVLEDSDGDGVYTGAVTMTVDDQDFTKGAARVTVTTVGKNKGVFPDGVVIGKCTWYQRGSALVYVTWDAAAHRGEPTQVSAVVRTKVLKFGAEIMLKPSLASEGTYQGNDFWADVIKSVNLRTELEAALGVIPLDPTWKLNPDISGTADDPGTLGNGYADIGEYLPYDNGVSVGHWNWVANWFKSAPKPVMVYVPIVDPGNKHDGWRIQAFAAFEITEWRDQGNRVAIIGSFERWLEGGKWDDTPPGPIYVEAAVLTDGQH